MPNSKSSFACPPPVLSLTFPGIAEIGSACPNLAFTVTNHIGQNQLRKYLLDANSIRDRGAAYQRMEKLPVPTLQHCPPPAKNSHPFTTTRSTPSNVHEG